MTEIDFIPQWYLASRQRKLWYRRQTMILGGIAIVIALWCLIAGRGLSYARAELAEAHSDLESKIGKIQLYEQLKTRHSALEAQKKILESIVPRTSYAAVLAELSHCTGPDVVMQKLTMRSEPIESGSREGISSSKKTARQSPAAGKTSGYPSSIQTRVILVGYAADAKGVAALISSLEQSNYFFRVTPIYSKNDIVNDRDVAEFEIQCVLADFVVLDGKE